MAGAASRTKREFREKLTQCTLKGIGNPYAGAFGKDSDRRTDRSRRSKPHDYVLRKFGTARQSQ